MSLTVRYVTHFVGRPGADIQVGASASGTNALDGNALVCGRPYPLGNSPVAVDPDANTTSIERDLSRLDGKFAILVRGEYRSVLATDILGSGSAFFAETHAGTLVSSSLGHIAREKGDLDYDLDGLVAALSGSLLVGNLTPFVGVRRLQAGEYLVVDHTNVTPARIRTYAEPADLLMSPSTTKGSSTRLMELLEASVSRELQEEPTGLLLTAGKDSRAIAYAASIDRAPDVTAYTYGGWRSVDRREARTAARQARMAHKRVGPINLRLARFADRIATFGGGRSGLQTAQHLAGAEPVGRLVDNAMVGFLGDILTGKPFDPSWDGQTRLVQRRNMPWLTRGGVRLEAEFPDQFNRLRSTLLESLGTYDDLPPGRAATLVDLKNRQATYISGTFDLLDQYVRTSSPFFFRPLMTYLLSLDIDDLTDQRLYQQMLDGESDRRPVIHSPGLVARVAGMADRRTGYQYDTVDWKRVLARHRGWLRSRLEPFSGEDRVAHLGLESLETESRLPLALFAIPIIDTMHRGPNGT